MTLLEKLMIGALGFGLIVVVFLFNHIAPKSRYRLPNGDIVECDEMVETSKGNFHLRGCADGSEYFIQGTVEKIK